MGLCPDHASKAERARGSSTERGYGHEHRTRAQELRRRFTGTPCSVCGCTLQRWQKLEAGHSTPLRVDPTSVADILVHADCNPRGTDPRNYAPQ